ncbi:FAD-dependent oxidoreductase [Panacibacter ginsenosidivorans]|uniref:D-amino-acid oxidase n=1 Tax=Panacibacter ginsenosidivorans TaxID=1813871 RepID=A0A5B8V3R2_9BACT|nr:FAD-dependent oxidoreductase [Panacibacter ginsenosidivorans]QEC66014.1 FAD-dependent oxidoreductase [Panacibacter ginsenosidivorans]
MGKKIAIIGAGISGMSSASLLKENGHDITIYANAFSPNITSNKAAAFWFPYHIRNDKRGINWCRQTYMVYTEMAKRSETGISMRKLIKVQRKGMEDGEPVWIDFMPKGSMRMMHAYELPEDIAIGYEVQVPLIETQIFLPFLQKKLTADGVKFIQQEIKGFTELTNDYDFVINCSALGSRSLCNDTSIISVRGQVALLSPLHDMHLYLDNEKPLYIVPRKDAIIIGGTYEEHVEQEQTEPVTIHRLLNNAYETFPFLKEQKVLGSWAGLRPYRPEVRVEHETETNIIHNYGHGGSGFTLAFGCAAEVAKIVEGL